MRIKIQIRSCIATVVLFCTLSVSPVTLYAQELPTIPPGAIIAPDWDTFVPTNGWTIFSRSGWEQWDSDDYSGSQPDNVWNVICQCQPKYFYVSLYRWCNGNLAANWGSSSVAKAAELTLTNTELSPVTVHVQGNASANLNAVNADAGGYIKGATEIGVSFDGGQNWSKGGLSVEVKGETDDGLIGTAWGIEIPAMQAGVADSDADAANKTFTNPSTEIVSITADCEAKVKSKVQGGFFAADDAEMSGDAIGSLNESYIVL